MNISFKWIGGATWTLQIDNIKIACDPVLCPMGTIQDYKYFKTERLNNPEYNESDFNNVNIWLLTHNHEDHIDKPGFEIIKKNSVIISHKGLRKLFKKYIYKNLNYLKWNEALDLSFDDIIIKVKAIPAIHARRKLFSGVVGNGNGYLLHIIKNNLQYNVYVTGDSVYDKSIIKYTGGLNIDLIIANAGAAMVGKTFLSRIIGRITNNISDIKRMSGDLNPGKLIVVHRGTFSHYSETINPRSFDDFENIKINDVGEIINLL